MIDGFAERYHQTCLTAGWRVYVNWSPEGTTESGSGRQLPLCRTYTAVDSATAARLV